MSASSPPLAARERAELADLLDDVGPGAPTCCEGWTTAHLAAHLVVRDRRVDALPGLGLEVVGLGGPLVAWAHRAADRLRGATPYTELVSRVRSGPARWLPMGWPGADQLLGTTEYVIHHEDVRRAQPGWAPRTLPRTDQDRLWTVVSLLAPGVARGRKGGLVLRRSDVPGVERRVGAGDTTVEGEPLELLLWAAGRRGVARVTRS